MNRGLFETQLNNITDLLKEIGLGQERVSSPKLPENPRAIFRNMKYRDIWELVFQEQYYHFRLADDSLFQFRIDSYRPLSIHYVYYECPYIPRMSYEEFFDLQTLEDGPTNEELEILFDKTTKDYGNYLQETIKDSVTPIRYDYEPNLYRPGLHPASHIHFGHGNQIKVSTKRILKPVSFFLFIMRQIYPDYWIKILDLENAEDLCRNIREKIDEVARIHWCPTDEMEMYFI